VIQAVFGGLSGAGGTAVLLALVSWLRGKRADRAGVNRINIDAALAVQAQSIEYVQHMMGPLEKRLAAADATVDKLRSKLEAAIRRAESAEAVLRDNNLPVPVPAIER
jgi:hypothetical protein